MHTHVYVHTCIYTYMYDSGLLVSFQSDAGQSVSIKWEKNVFKAWHHNVVQVLILSLFCSVVLIGQIDHVSYGGMVWSDNTTHPLRAHQCRSHKHYWSLRWISNHIKINAWLAGPFPFPQRQNAQKHTLWPVYLTAIWNNLTELSLRQIYCFTTFFCKHINTVERYKNCNSDSDFFTI